MSLYTRYTACITSIAIIVVLCTTTANAQQSIAAAHTPVDDKIFIESAPIEQLSDMLKKAYASLRGEQGASELMVLGTMLQSKTGFNPFDPVQLSKAGIQTKKPFAVSFNKIVQPALAKQPTPPGDSVKSEPIPWTLFIPVGDANAVYKNLKTAFSKPEPAKLGEPAKPAPVIRELMPGKLFTVDKSDIFVAKGKEFVIISNDRNRALTSLAKRQKNLSQNKEYIAYRKHIARFYEKDSPAFTFFVNNKGFQDDYFSAFFGKAGSLTSQNPLLVESNAELITSAGAVFIGSEGMIVHSDSIYNEAYFSDTSKLFPRLLNNPRVPTEADFSDDGIAAYASINFNVSAFKKLMEAINPEAMQKIYLSNQLLKSQKNTDLVGNIFDNATGTVTLIAPRFPAYQDISSLDTWDLSIHIGFKSEKRETITRTFSDFINLIAPSSKNSTFEKITLAGEDVWSITNTQMVKKPLPKSNGAPAMDGQNTPPQNQEFTMEQKTSTTYVYFSKSEAVIAFNKDFMKSIIAKKGGLPGTQFAERRMEVKPEHLRDMNTCFYVRGDAVIDVIKNSPAMTFIAPAVPMLSKIHSLSFISRHEKNAVFTKFWIKFNGNAIGL